MKEKLIEICKSHILSADIEVVIREPYIPHIPSDWNGILVLAESQNLPAHDEGYLNDLRSMSPDERIDRLNLNENSIAVGPWNDGSLKLALESVYEHVSSERTAVSNAALWSQRKDDGFNDTPDDDVQHHSSVIWKAMLELMKPKLVICSGKVAQFVIDKTEWGKEKSNQSKIVRWRSPSPRAMSRLINAFDATDLLNRYPEVQQALKKHEEWGEPPYRRGKIIFACHAVSVTQAQRKHNG